MPIVPKKLSQNHWQSCSVKLPSFENWTPNLITNYTRLFEITWKMRNLVFGVYSHQEEQEAIW